MTTPPNQNTADQSGAMQPTSSASSADNSSRMKFEQWYMKFYWNFKGKEFDFSPYNVDVDAYAHLDVELAYRSWKAAIESQAIVPQVVQAPIDTMVELQDELWRAAIEKAVADLRELAKTELNDSFTFQAGFESAIDEFASRLLDNSEAVTAPIVATVPSGWKLVPILPTDEMCEAAWESDGADYVGEHKRIFSVSMAYEAILNAAPAAPSTAEQASDVRNAAIEECAVLLECGFDRGIRAKVDQCKHKRFGWEECDHCNIDALRALKSATPADKGNQS